MNKIFELFGKDFMKHIELIEQGDIEAFNRLGAFMEEALAEYGYLLSIPTEPIELLEDLMKNDGDQK